MLEKLEEGYTFEEAFGTSDQTSEKAISPEVLERFKNNLRFLLKNHITTVPIVLSQGTIGIPLHKLNLDSDANIETPKGCSVISDCKSQSG